MKITIHQPEHLIWLGLVHKIYLADVFVILDTVQFEKNNWQNRNKIRGESGAQWLTVPIKKHHLETPINEIVIASATKIDWRTSYLDKLTNCYRRAKYFDIYFSEIKKLAAEASLLVDFNIKLIEFVLKIFEVETKIYLASELNLPPGLKNNELLIVICNKLGGKEYISGSGGKNYLNLGLFEQSGIKLIWHEFSHPSYQQLYDPFIAGMSSIDIIFNYGPEAKNILFNKHLN